MNINGGGGGGGAKLQYNRLLRVAQLDHRSDVVSEVSLETSI